MDGFPILSVMTYAPVVGALIIFLWPKASPNASRWIAMIASLVSLVLSLILIGGFNIHASGMQFTEFRTWLPAVGVAYNMGVDGISVPLIVLTTILSTIAILASWKPVQLRVREYMITMLLLETGMLGVFVSLDLFLFYIFWEIMLIPMALLIGVWGHENRVYAAVKFFLYTLAGSLLMLVAIIATYQSYFNQTGVRTLNVLTLATGHYSHNFQMWVFAAFFLAFAIKVPMFPFHTWLPDAHVEAPTAGSVLLAGVLLKMGGYGLLRFNLSLYPDAARTWAPYIIILSIIGIIYGALVALPQPNLKKLVAYSSVSHMGFVTLGIFSFTAQGLDGAMIVMISHGLVTGALFLCVGMVYVRSHSLMISRFGGLATNMPIYGSFLLVFTLASLGLPGLSGFVGEFLSILGAFRDKEVYGILALAVVILSAWYMLWMYQRVAWQRAPGELPDASDPASRLVAAGASGGGHGGHGDVPPVAGGSGHEAVAEGAAGAEEHVVPTRSFPDLDWQEIVTLVPLACLTIFIGIYPQWIIHIFEPTLRLIARPFGGFGF